MISPEIQGSVDLQSEKIVQQNLQGMNDFERHCKHGDSSRHSMPNYDHRDHNTLPLSLILACLK